MFDQIKDLYNLKKQADQLQKQMAQELITAVSSDGMVSVTLNGNQELVDIKITDSELNAAKIEQGFKEAFSKAQSQLKNLMAEKFKGML